MRISTRPIVQVGGILIAFAVFLVALLPTVAYASAASVSIDTIKRGPEGAYVALRDPVTPESLGLTTGDVCRVASTGINGDSAHPLNNIQVGDINEYVTLADVEAYSGKVTTASGLLTLPPLISFALIFGPDGVYSGKLTVNFTCDDPPAPTTTTTTTTPDPEAPTTTTTTPAPTTTTTNPGTTTPPPIGPPETGGGACADGACEPDSGLLVVGLLSLAGTVTLAAAAKVGMSR